MLLFVLSLIPFVYASQLYPIALTDNGKIRGQYVHKFGNINVNQFLSVPYALPPIGPRRFQRPSPLPYDPSKTIDATHFAPTCVQHRHLHEVVNPLLNVDLKHEVIVIFVIHLSINFSVFKLFVKLISI